MGEEEVKKESPQTKRVRRIGMRKRKKSTETVDEERKRGRRRKKTDEAVGNQMKNIKGEKTEEGHKKKQ